MRQWTPFLLLIVLAAAVLAPWVPEAVSTPTYAARAGRLCDNCHLDPGKWQGLEWKDRKCSLSCQGCHVDPSGGGMRTASGRFYGASTLPAVASQPRPTRDWDKDLFGMFHRQDKRTVYNEQFPRGPETVEASKAYQEEDRWAWGAPAEPHSQSRVQGRYGTLAADPVFRLGWDVRTAMLYAFTPYNGNQALVFPMQADLGAVLHPGHHVFLLTNVGARGRASGYDQTVEDPATPYLRDGFLLLSEFPYQAYLKAGRFVPSYGLRLDDHTAFIRRRTTVDTSLPDSRVWGVEVGAAPNYPFVSLGWFKSKAEGVAPEPWQPWDTDEAWGASLNAGYRELGWTLGASALLRQNYVDAERNMNAFGAYAVWNLWSRWQSVPLTYQVEVDRVSRERTGIGHQVSHVLWEELSWAATNGVNLLLGHSWEDPDREIGYDEAHRVHLGTQFTPYPGVTFDLRVRRLLARRAPNRVVTADAPSPNGTDIFFQIHLW